MNFLETSLLVISDFLLLMDIWLALLIISPKTKITKKSHLIIIIILFIMFSIIYYRNYIDVDIFFGMILLGLFYLRYIIILYIYTRQNLSGVAYISFIIIFCVSLIQDSFTNLKSYLIPVLDSDIYTTIDYIIIRVILILLFCLLYKSNQKTYWQKSVMLISKPIYVLIIIDIFIISALTTFINFDLKDIKLKSFIINIIIFLFMITSLFIILSLITNTLSKKYYHDVNNILEKQIKCQLTHYEQTEKLNEDIRRFKHDYHNHMLSLKSILAERKIEEAINYIEKLTQTTALAEKQFTTGNYIADSILTEKQEINNNITIEFEGHIPNMINHVDLCIVLSNALDNAVEACDYMKEAKITVKADIKQGYFILAIVNPVKNRVNISSNGLLPTIKKDKLQHGFGLGNIKRVVEKYDGILDVECNDERFLLYTSMKL